MKPVPGNEETDNGTCANQQNANNPAHKYSLKKRHSVVNFCAIA